MCLAAKGSCAGNGEMWHSSSSSSSSSSNRCPAQHIHRAANLERVQLLVLDSQQAVGPARYSHTVLPRFVSDRSLAIRVGV